MRYEMKRALVGGAGADPDPRGVAAVRATIPDLALMKLPLTLRNSDTIPGRLLLTLEGTTANTAVVEIWALDDTDVDRQAGLPELPSIAGKGAREFSLVATLTVTVGELLSFPGVIAGVAAAVASLVGVAGTFPTAFSGGETLILSIDGVPFTTTFLVGDQSNAEVVTAINAEALSAGIPVPPASVDGGEIRLTGWTTGSSGHVTVTGGTGAATLGLSGTATGTDGVAAQQQADNMPGPGTIYARVTTAPAADAVLKVAAAN